MTAAKTHLFNVPLIYRENLADLRAAEAIDRTSSLFCQHRTGEQQVAAGAALAAIAFAGKKLALYISLSEMDQPKTPYFAGAVKHKAGILKRLSDSENQTMEKSCKTSGLVKPPVYAMANLLHVRSC
jgi:hypothetical protein